VLHEPPTAGIFLLIFPRHRTATDRKEAPTRRLTCSLGRVSTSKPTSHGDPPSDGGSECRMRNGRIWDTKQVSDEISLGSARGSFKAMPKGGGNGPIRELPVPEVFESPFNSFFFCMFALFRAVGEAWVGLAEVEHRRAKLFPCSSSVSSIGGPTRCARVPSKGRSD
jgi:hypothetical protein